MAEIRLSKLTKQFSIGLQRLVDFLNEKGANVEMNPNAKVSDEYLPAIEAKFGEDQKLKEDSEKVTIKLKEIIELGSKKKPEHEEEDALPEKEVVIKTNTLNSEPVVQESAPEVKPAAEPVAKPVEETPKQEGGIKVVDKIDLSKFEKKAPKAEEPAPAPAVEPTPAPAPEPAPVPVAEEPAPAPVAEAKSEPREVKVEVERLAGPKVVDKIDLSQFDKKKKKKKRERIEKGGSQKVDVTKVEAEPKKKDNKGGKPGAPAQQQNQGKKNDKKSRRDRGGDKFKPMTEAEQEEMQKEIQKQIKETYARMNEGKKQNFGAKHRKDKREAASQRMQEELEMQQLEQKVLKVTEFVTVNDLATLMNNTPVTKVIGACMSLGMMVSINQRLDAETLVLVAEEFGYEVEFVTANLTDAIAQGEAEDTDEDLLPRPPVITVMGHVDHGKTSLLDHIRNANVIAGEAGGITQHIGAYHVQLPDGQAITFLDTPGHEAFTAMRARGAKMTDVAIIIVAADDCIMPQTVEAINHAQAAGVPMVFAINKIDKPGANPEKIREQLSQMNILVEDWGGKYQCQEISAKKGINVEQLLEKVLLEAEMLELKANPNKRASGAVIESSLDKGCGYLATILVQNGTLRVGDVMLSGCYTGKVKAMYNERGQKVTEAGPSTPVSVLGLNGAPTAGETFVVMADEKEAKDIANKREQLSVSRVSRLRSI